MLIDDIRLPLRLATEEINRICAELERLQQPAFFPSKDPDESSGYLRNSLPDDFELLSKAKRMLRDRRNREISFPTAMFADPQWDILLDLFAAKLAGRNISVSSACLGACVPPTTALRHLSCMVENGLLERTTSDHDARLRYITLTQKACATMREYLDQVQMIGS